MAYGDDRGSVDRSHNRFDTPVIAPDEVRRLADQVRMSAGIVRLSESMRQSIQSTIAEVCEHRQWELLAIHVRTTHVHAVVTANCRPEMLLNSFKSWATRKLREDHLASIDEKIWSRHGSTRYLWKPEHVVAAIRYVVLDQGAVLIPAPWIHRLWSEVLGDERIQEE